MACEQDKWLSNQAYMQQLNMKVARNRIPLSGSLELTQRCNLRCAHCYLGDQAVIRKNRLREFSTAQWLTVIDEITEAGCLFLLITGGEPFLRKDFKEIYGHAKKKGLLVTVFTNGTMVTDPILALFRDIPPYTVEISLYGATQKTYETITGVKGSHRQCLRGIERLIDKGVNVKLKTMLMTLNAHEFHDIENMAGQYGVKFRFDGAISPCINGDKSPVNLRVPPEEVVDKEFESKDRFQSWKDYYDRIKESLNSHSDALYSCGSGMTTFFINAYGNLQPCLMVNDTQYSLATGGSFEEGWRDVMPRIRERKAGSAIACNQCDKKELCGFCPPFFKLETGAEDVPSDYLCAIGHYRLKTIKQMEFKGLPPSVENLLTEHEPLQLERWNKLSNMPIFHVCGRA